MVTEISLELLSGWTTPYYLYDMNILSKTLDSLNAASNYPGFKVHYAVKANSNSTILDAIAKAGLGADTVSGGEIREALAAGVKAADIVYAGVGKSDEEIRYALSNGIGCMNVESIEELMIIAQLASEMGYVARVAIRVNPEIDAHTHKYITTGIAENKFGVAMSMLDKVVDYAVASSWLEFKGLHFHIGSQIESVRPFELLCDRILEIQQHLNRRNIEIEWINVGGGLGIDYNNPLANPIPDFRSYFETFYRRLPLRQSQELHFELGRSIVAQCGSLVSRVLYVKQGVEKKFMILDAGMNDLIRPALYQAHHAIVNLSSKSTDEVLYTVVGPVCESADCFAEDILLPKTERGDLVAILSAGAYGESMSSNYNSRAKAPSHFI